MAKTLEQYVAEATNAYTPSTTALQSQLDSLSSQLDTTNEQINRNYAQQQASLDRSKNAAASQASMNAASTGGAFGGATNIANRKYYDQTYVPAVTQLQTNQANELASARQSNEDTRNSLNSQLASIQSQANQQALAQYYSDIEAEKTRQNNLAVANAQNAAQQAYYEALLAQANAQNATDESSDTGTLKNWDFGDGYSIQEMPNGTASYRKNGTIISAGEFLTGTSGNTNWDLWNDVWNNNVSTAGVGSDTIETFRRNAALNSGLTSNSGNALSSNALQNNNTYKYLWEL